MFHFGGEVIRVAQSCYAITTARHETRLRKVVERGYPMPDIQLRFQKDMLVLSAPLDTLLSRQGIDASLDRQYLNVMEPESLSDAFRLELAAGAQCLVATTEDITQARLAHLRMDTDPARLARAALAVANDARPQHTLVEIGPCGLPLDAASKASLNENRNQYANAARLFEEGAFDAFFLNGFTRIADLKCALMGVAQVSDKPVFASVTIGVGERLLQSGQVNAPAASSASDEGVLSGLPFSGYTIVDAATSAPLPAAKRAYLDPERWPEAIDAMVDLGASVVGFETAEPIASALDYAKTAVARTDLPILAQLCVTQDPDSMPRKGLTPLADIDEYIPDTMATCAVKLYGAGVQFLRATGLATPVYTGALAATVAGLDVRRA